jgi:hypothetical protein
MFTVLAVISCALVIVAISAAVNRRRASLPYSARTSETVDGASSWMPAMSGDDGVPARTQAVVMAVGVASKDKAPGSDGHESF